MEDRAAIHMNHFRKLFLGQTDSLTRIAKPHSLSVPFAWPGGFLWRLVQTCLEFTLTRHAPLTGI
jgi:hypothetical protein